MKIDLKFLRDLESNIEAQDLKSGKINVNSASRLDYRIKNKMKSNSIEEIINDFDVLISTQQNLISDLTNANRNFSSLKDINDSIKIHDFVSVIGATQLQSLEEMFGDQVKSLDGLKLLISRYEVYINNALSHETWYEVEDGESLEILARKLENSTGNWDVICDGFDYNTEYVLDKISGGILFQLYDGMIDRKSKLLKTIENIKNAIESKLSISTTEISTLLALQNIDTSTVRTRKDTYLDLEYLIEDLQIEQEIGIIDKYLEKLKPVIEPIVSLQKQKMMLESMAYQIRMAEMVKPYEEVINNEDFDIYGKNIGSNLLTISGEDVQNYFDVFGELDNAIVDNIYDPKSDKYTSIIVDTNIITERYVELLKQVSSSYIPDFATAKDVAGKTNFMSKLINSFDIFFNQNQNYLTELQQKVYWYHYNKFGKEKANGYINALADQINNKKGLEHAYNYLNSKGEIDYIDNLELFFNGLGDGILSTFEGIVNLIAPDGIRSESDYAKMYLLQILNKSTYTQENLEKLRRTAEATEQEIKEFKMLVNLSTQLGEQVWRNLSEHSYQVGSAVGYMALPIAMNLFLPGSGSALLFASTMGNAMEQSYQTKGFSSWETYVYGALTALSEVAMEKLGGLPGFGNPAKGFIRSVLSEGKQEFFQTFINGVIDSAHFNTEFDLTELSQEAVKAGIYGILTAGIIQGPGAIVRLTTKMKQKGANYNIKDALTKVTDIAANIITKTKGIIPSKFEANTKDLLHVEKVINLIQEGEKYNAINYMKNLTLKQKALLIEAINIDIADEMLRNSLIEEVYNSMEQTTKKLELLFSEYMVLGEDPLYEVWSKLNKNRKYRGFDIHMVFDFIISQKDFLIKNKYVSTKEYDYHLRWYKNLARMNPDFKVADVYPDGTFVVGSVEDLTHSINKKINISDLLTILSNEALYNEEIERLKSSPDRNIYLHAYNVLYNNVFGIGLEISKEALSRLEQLSDLYDKNYQEAMQKNKIEEDLLERTKNAAIETRFEGVDIPVYISENYWKLKTIYVIEAYKKLPSILKDKIKSIYFIDDPGKSSYWEFVFSMDNFVSHAYANYATGEIGYYSQDSTPLSYSVSSLYHEAAHLLDENRTISQSIEWQEAIDADKFYPTDYSRENNSENFAESLKYYFEDPERSRRESPQKTKYIETVLGIISK